VNLNQDLRWKGEKVLAKEIMPFNNCAFESLKVHLWKDNGFHAGER
jgi:hypothetical protein